MSLLRVTFSTFDRLRFGATDRRSLASAAYPMGFAANASERLSLRNGVSMSNSNQPQFDESHAHRWFAVEANNLSWDLVERADRNDADTEKMLHAAHAAWFHWDAVGTALNRLRAEVLLATTYHAAGRAGPAVWHAERAITALADAGASATAFDRVSANAAAAAAFAAVSQSGVAAARLSEARSAAARLDNADDRAVAERFYPAIRADVD